MGKLTPELRRVLKLQYPEDIVTEVKGEIVHFKDTRENWEKLGTGLGLELFKETTGKGNLVLYNPKNFKEVKNEFESYLLCISEENIELPINCSSCYQMFSGFKFHNKDALKNFDTFGVTNMGNMFSKCKFPNGFSLGDKFDTSNVIYMESMFQNAYIKDGFSLGDKFNTSKVTTMYEMFENCSFSYGFSLGNKFDTSSVTTMRWMFRNCKFPNGFSLGDKFDTNNVECMGGMFWGCQLPNGFSLGDKFDTSHVGQMNRMFEDCRLPIDFSLDNKFDISNVENMNWMFESCQLPEGKTEKDFDNDYNKIIVWLKLRNPKNSDKTSNTSFFSL